MLILIGAGLCGWLFSSITPLEETEIEPRRDWGTNGMSEKQCATSLKFNSTHFLCESEDNHNI